MTYQLERSSIEAYFIAQWASATPVYMDGHIGEPVENSVRLSINSGRVLQGSVGRVSNRIDHVGTVVVAIYTPGDEGSAAWRGYAETIQGIFHGKTIDDAGAVITAHADAFVRFSPVGPGGAEEQHPYISASFKDAPFHITNITVPFIRYGYR